VSGASQSRLFVLKGDGKLIILFAGKVQIRFAGFQVNGRYFRPGIAQRQIGELQSALGSKMDDGVVFELDLGAAIITGLQFHALSNGHIEERLLEALPSTPIDLYCALHIAEADDADTRIS
jgi:hypothetical protein